MRVVLILLTIFCLFTLAAAGGFAYWQLHEARQRLDHIWSDYASAQKAARALDDHQAQINVLRNGTNNSLDNIRRQLNSVHGDLNRINESYASAQKVDARLAKLQVQIDQARADITKQTKPTPTPTHFVELGFRNGNDVVLVLRYSGNSIQHALTSKSQTQAAPELLKAIKAGVDGRQGVVTFNTVMLRTPAALRLIALGGANPSELKVTRSAAEANDWDLTAEARKQLGDMLRDY